MKILLVITKAELGGAQTFILHLARNLKLSGCDVCVVAGDGAFLPNELEKVNIPFYYFESLKRDASILTSYKFIREFYRFLKKNKFDIVHLNSTNTLLAAVSIKLLKQKPRIVFTVHGLSLVDNNSAVGVWIRHGFRIFYSIFLKLVDKIIFVSKKNYEEALQNKIVRQGEVIYNAISITASDFLSQEDARRYFFDNYNINLDNTYLLGSIGRLAYPKNYDFLIGIFPKIKAIFPNAHILIIGTGPHKSDYLKKIQGDPVYKDFHLVGAIPFSYRYLKAFDVFILPSIFEGLSISLLEAMYSGVPILASAVGGTGEILNSTTKLILSRNWLILEKMPPL